MRFYIILIFSTLFLWSCQPSDQWDTSSLTEDAQYEIKYSLSRYWEKAPKRAFPETKFETEFDEYYQQKSEQAILSKYYLESNDTVYLEIHKRAPSLADKWVAVGIKTVQDGTEIHYYEEVYRTWKFTTPILEEKTAVIFSDWINKKALDPYFPEHNTEEFIEFPDNNNYYDIHTKQWVQRNKIQL